MLQMNYLLRKLALNIISYVNTIQALDKIAAYIMQTFFEIESVKHTLILELNSSNNKIESSKTIFEIFSKITNQLVVLGKSNIHDEAIDVFMKQAIPTSLVKKDFGISQYDKGLFLNIEEESEVARFIAKNTNLLIQRNKIDTPCAKLLYKNVLKRNGQVLRFFKSLHDKDAGLTANHIGFNKKVIKAARYTLMRLKNPKIQDYLLVHGREFENSIENAQLFYYKKKKIAYPLVLPAWKEEMINYGKSKISKDKYIVSLFVRGNIDKRPQNEQILPTAVFKRQLKDVIWCFDQLRRNTCFIVKPHPNQNPQELDNAIYGLGKRDISISYDPPSLLASYSNISIGMSTSAILDALFLGKPVIDYSEDNPARRMIHPKGSLLQIMGIPSVDNRKDLLNSLKQIVGKRYDFPKLNPYVGDQTDMRKILLQ